MWACGCGCGGMRGGGVGCVLRVCGRMGCVGCVIYMHVSFSILHIFNFIYTGNFLLEVVLR